MSVKVFPPQATSATLAAAIAASLVGDWAEVSDDRGYTGRVLFEIIGEDFEPYRRLKTIEDIAAESGAVSVIAGDAQALGVLSKSASAVPEFVFALPLGAPFAGGFIAPDMDTTQGNIIASDASQTGLDYRLILAPKSREATGLMWKNARTAGPAGTRTRWDGLGATLAMVAGGAAYQAALYCNGLDYPDDGGSQWYLPAMDELEALFRAFKTTTENNYLTAATGSTFPGGTQNQGVNPSSAPPGAAYTATVPAQTSLALWQSGGVEAFGASGSNIYFWSATEYDATGAWYQYFSGSDAGRQDNGIKDYTARLVRPVRRFVR